jgi:thiol:disulfide interchange protein
MRRAASSIPVLFAFALCAFAQRLDPVQWTLISDQQKVPPGGTVVARLTAHIDPGWHVYAPTTPRGGPIPTSIQIDNPAVASADVYEPKPDEKFDPNFSLNVEWYENQVTFVAFVHVAKDAKPGPLALTAKARYQSCDDRQCLPPRTKTAGVTVNVDPAAPAVNAAAPAGYRSIAAIAPAAPPEAPKAPVSPASGVAGQSLAQFLLIAFGLGLAAIFTPCCFPMIPITVSFFLNQKTGSRRESLMQAVVFCLGIVVLFCGFGFAVTAIVGPFGVVQLGSNPWVNGFIALVFFIFGLSLLGAFEITLPSRLLTKLDNTSRAGGYFGTLIMGLTFSLTSFACVGPFVGTLLAASVQTGGMQPLFGMLLFAAGLATPFFFLALFPSYLQRLPRSGGWMARVKVVLGFVIIAVMFKYLSNVDQVLHTNLLSRGVFLAAWFVLFLLPGLYLLGFLRMEGVKPEDRLGVGRVLTAAAFLIFAVSLVPGMFGWPLGPIEAYVPAPSETAAALVPGGARGSAQVWLQNDYKEALARARAENKYVLVTFTGYACTNCHWMKADMFPRPQIASAVRNMILVELYTDGTDAASKENQDFEQNTFDTVSIPFYALMDASGKVIASFGGATRDAGKFLAFLNTRPAQS